MHPKMDPSSLNSLRAAIVACAIAASFLPGCQEEEPARTGSETNFLVWCPADGDCGELTCLCGVCTDPCADDGACAHLSPNAVCVSRTEASHLNACEEPSTATCELPCDSDSDCASLGGAHRCDRGACRNLPDDCPRGETRAGDVLILGDLLLGSEGEVVEELESLARSGGALGPDESYRGGAGTITTAFGGGEDPLDAYELARSEGIPRFIVLDLGGPDSLLACPEPITAQCPALETAATGAEGLLAQFANDEVEQVVLFFYPDPDDPELAQKFDVLRPLMEGLCESAPLPCHFVDLRAVFAEAPDLYLLDGGVLPTAEGARATAEVLFSVMERHCVAQ